MKKIDPTNMEENMTLFLGLSEKEITLSVDILSRALSNTFLLYTKTWNYHWNIEDQNFASLHKFLNEQYETLGETVDDIAERIRKLGKLAPSGVGTYLKLATLREDEVQTKNATDMLKNLFSDHEIIITTYRQNLKNLEDSQDQGTIDFLITLLRMHEKFAWMLRAHFA